MRSGNLLRVLLTLSSNRRLVDYELQGGEGQTYHDVFQGVNGPHVRANCVVNVDSSMVVSYTAPTEWLAYTVTGQAGVYNVAFSMSGQPPTTVPLQMFLTLDSSCSASQPALLVDNYFTTGNYASPKTESAGRITLPGGTVTLRVCFVTVSYMNFYGFTLTSAASQPYNGKYAAVPGSINAALFDTGGEGISYHKTNTGWPVVRSDSTVAGGSNFIGYMDSGEWVKYSVTAASSGTFNVKYMLTGSPADPITLGMHMVIDGECSTGTATGQLNTNAFTTHNWSPGSPFSGGSIYLSAGSHILSVCFDNVPWANFYGLQITAGPYNGNPLTVPATIPAGQFDWVRSHLVPSASCAPTSISADPKIAAQSHPLLLLLDLCP